MLEHIPPRARLPRPDQGIHVEDHQFFISADLGQANDFTAISILERIVKGNGILGLDAMGERSYHLRHLERPPRGTEYTVVVNRLAELYHSPPLADTTKSVVIDYTGVGRPVYDLMVKSGFYYSLNAISITGGEQVTYNGPVMNVPKRDLITNLQVLLQNGSFRIAKGIKETEALVEEMTNFQVKISATGHDVYGARNGVHDDLVLSVAMGAWLATRRSCRTGWGMDM